MFHVLSRVNSWVNYTSLGHSLLTNRFVCLFVFNNVKLVPAGSMRPLISSAHNILQLFVRCKYSTYYIDPYSWLWIRSALLRLSKMSKYLFHRRRFSICDVNGISKHTNPDSTFPIYWQEMLISIFGASFWICIKSISHVFQPLLLDNVGVSCSCHTL